MIRKPLVMYLPHAIDGIRMHRRGCFSCIFFFCVSRFLHPFSSDKWIPDRALLVLRENKENDEKKNWIEQSTYE